MLIEGLFGGLLCIIEWLIGNVAFCWMIRCVMMGESSLVLDNGMRYSPNTNMSQSIFKAGPGLASVVRRALVGRDASFHGVRRDCVSQVRADPCVSAH